MKIASIIALITANIAPLVGVLFFGWSIFAVMFLYWFENIVIGYYNLLKIHKSRAPIKDKKIQFGNFRAIEVSTKRFLVNAFIMHYGVFTLVHGAFIFALFGKSWIANYGSVPDASNLWGVIFAAVLLFVSHGVSYLVNFVGNREFEIVAADSLFIQPYKRVIVMHLTILLGGALIVNGKVAEILGYELDTSIGAIAVLVVLKILLDAYFHRIEHLKPGFK